MYSEQGKAGGVRILKLTTEVRLGYGIGWTPSPGRAKAEALWVLWAPF